MAALVEYEDLLPKNEVGSRTHLTCELCGFEPKTKNKYRERQDHLLRSHFMDRMTEIFPTFHHFNCPSSDCVFIGKDKQSLMRHYISKHGFIDTCLRDALAERGIEYVAPGYERALKKRPQAGEVNPEYVTHEYIEEHQVMGDDTIVFVELDDNQAQAYESNVYEEADGSEVVHHNQRVLGHIPVGDGMMGTITLLDQQQEEERSPQKKRKFKPIPYQDQFAHLTHDDKKKKKKKRRPSPDPNEDSKTKALRKIFEKNTDDEWDSDDSDSEGSNLDFIEVPQSERRLKKDVKNYRMLQLFVLDLERENATLRRENKTLRARTDVLLDIMIEQQGSGGISQKTLQRINSNHNFQNATLLSEVKQAAKQQQLLQKKQSKPAESDEAEEVEEVHVEQREAVSGNEDSEGEEQFNPDETEEAEAEADMPEMEPDNTSKTDS